jgi:hypothetical protein
MRYQSSDVSTYTLRLGSTSDRKRWGLKCSAQKIEWVGLLYRMTQRLVAFLADHYYCYVQSITVGEKELYCCKEGSLVGQASMSNVNTYG